MRAIVTAILAIGLLGGCDPYDPPEDADPRESIAPEPKDTTLVPTEEGVEDEDR